MKIIFRSVKDELTRLINKAHEEGKIIERVELDSEEFSALISEYERAAHREDARREGKVSYLGTWVVNTEHRPSGDSWSLFMSIDTDCDAALQFEGRRYCLYQPNFNKQFEGDLEYIRSVVNKMTVPVGGKYERHLRTHLQNLRAAIESGEPFHVIESGNQDIEITLEKVERA